MPAHFIHTQDLVNQHQRGNHFPNTARTLRAKREPIALCTFFDLLNKPGILRHNRASFPKCKCQVNIIICLRQSYLFRAYDINPVSAQTCRDCARNVCITIKPNLLSHALCLV